MYLKSTLILLVMIGAMFGIAFFLANSESLVTGSVTTDYTCNENYDCYDGNDCTQDKCLESVCSSTPIPNCS